MSAFGTKRTFLDSVPMSAFGVKRTHQIGFTRTVRARACARVMGSYWDAMTTSVAANSDRSWWCRRRKDRPLCGAKTRAGGTCLVRVELGKARCRLHGGLSTGPKTESGRARIAEAQRRRWRRICTARNFAVCKEPQRLSDRQRTFVQTGRTAESVRRERIGSMLLKTAWVNPDRRRGHPSRKKHRQQRISLRSLPLQKRTPKKPSTTNPKYPSAQQLRLSERAGLCRRI